MAKFKVGDRVRIRTWESMEKEFGTNGTYIETYPSFNETMGKLSGMTAVITSMETTGTRIELKFDEKRDGVDTDWFYSTDMVEPVMQVNQITITDKKNGKVSAVLTENGKYVRSANAKCNPDDTFDFNVGATLAFNRLMGIEDKPVDANIYKEVKRPAKVGEWIKIVNSESKKSYVNGEIFKVEYNDSPSYDGVYFKPISGITVGYRHSNVGCTFAKDSEYVVLENYNPQQNSTDTFDWEKFKKTESKIAVNCKTKELADDFLKQCDEHGIKWCSGTRTTEPMLLHKETFSCFRADSKMGWCNADWYVRHGCTIIEWGEQAKQCVELSSVSNEELITELKNRLNK